MINPWCLCSENFITVKFSDFMFMATFGVSKACHSWLIAQLIPQATPQYLFPYFVLFLNQPESLHFIARENLLAITAYQNGETT